MLDYQIFHILDNYKIDGFTRYDYVRSEIWVRTTELCRLLNEELKIDINPNTQFETDREIAWRAWLLLKERGLTGTYGTEYLNKQ